MHETWSQNVAKHYARLLSRWPKDPLRPENTFHKLLSARAAKANSLSDTEVNAELRNVNALYSLLDDRYKKKVCARPIVPWRLEHRFSDDERHC